MKKLIRKLLRENLNDMEYDSTETFFGYKEEVMFTLVSDILANKGLKQSFQLAPIYRINKIWKYFAEHGIVLDEKGIEVIGMIFVRNIAMLSVNTELAGHTRNRAEDILIGFDDELTPEQVEFILGDGLDNYIEDYNGQLRISDYGLPKLENLAFKFLSKDNTAEEKLMTIDMMLNVVHQRSDLSRIFVEGGVQSLDMLFTD